MVPLSAVEEAFDPKPHITHVTDTTTIQAVTSRLVSTGIRIASQSVGGVVVAFPPNNTTNAENSSLDNGSTGSEGLHKAPISRACSKEGSVDCAFIGGPSPMQTDDLTRLYSLAEVCSSILNDSTLAHSHVLAFRWYSQVDLGIKHHFIVLELWSGRLTSSWLRFDRRPSWHAPLAKIAASGALAKDSAVLSTTLSDVLGLRATMLECDFRLEKVPELQMLVPFFRIFMQTVPRYRLWKENCWFLSSLIAGLLVRLGDGIFESGRLLYPNIATELRRYMYLRYFIEIGVSPGFLTEMEQIEYLLIKYRPGIAGRTALIKLKSQVHESCLDVAGMTISALKKIFAVYTWHFLRKALHLQPAPPRKTLQLVRVLATIAGDAFMDDLHYTARSASAEAIVILRGLLSCTSLIDLANSTPIFGLHKPKNVGKAVETGDALHNEDDEILLALSEAYNSLGDAYKAMSQWNMAERAYDSGVRVLRLLSGRHPQEFLKPLCLQLSALAMTQLGMGKFQASAISRHESIMLRRQICVESARTCGRQFTNRALGPPAPPGSTARNYTEQCVDVCRSLYREARGIHFVDQECIRIRRMLHQDNEPLHREHLARTLLAHARSLYHVFLVQARDLNPITPPVLKHHTVMDPEEPLLEIEDLVRALNQQGWNLATLGRYRLAAEVFGESVSISRTLQSRDPPGVGVQNLPYSLCALGDCLYSSARLNEALPAIEEGVSLARQWHSGSAFLANLLASYCRTLRAAGRLADAVAAGTESSELWEQILKADPVGNFGAKIAFSKFALTNALIRADDFTHALIIARQALTELGRLMEIDIKAPQKLQDISPLVRAAIGTRDFLGSPWVVANLHGELNDLIRNSLECNNTHLNT